jgi:hypothetical protein
MRLRGGKQQQMVLVGALLPDPISMDNYCSIKASYRSNQPYTTTVFSPGGTRIAVIQNLTVSAQPDVSSGKLQTVQNISNRVHGSPYAPG